MLFVPHFVACPGDWASTRIGIHRFGGRHDQDHHSCDSCVAILALKSKSVCVRSIFSGIDSGTHLGQSHARRMGYLEASPSAFVHLLASRAWSSVHSSWTFFCTRSIAGGLHRTGAAL